MPRSQNQVASVRQQLILLDRSGTADAEDRRTSVVVLLESRAQADHADDLVALQRVGNHLAVARFKDHEGPGDVRKERRLWQGKERDLRRKIGGPDLRDNAAHEHRHEDESSPDHDSARLHCGAGGLGRIRDLPIAGGDPMPELE